MATQIQNLAGDAGITDSSGQAKRSAVKKHRTAAMGYGLLVAALIQSLYRTYLDSSSFGFATALIVILNSVAIYAGIQLGLESYRKGFVEPRGRRGD